MDKNSLTIAFTSMQSRLRSIAARIAGESNADDALQDAFCRLWCRVDDAHLDDDAEGMSVQTVRHRSIDMARQQQRHIHLQFNEALANSPTSSTDDETAAHRFDVVSQIIRKELPERQRNILLMRDYQGLSFNDIANETGLTEANVRQILSRARGAVRSIYRNINTDDYE